MVLAKEKCVACTPESPRVTDSEMKQLQMQIPDWKVVHEGNMPTLQRTYSFQDFAQAIAFANKVGDLAEAEGHHPRLIVEWGKVGVGWWTHAIGGLHRNDFIMAAKSDDLYKQGGSAARRAATAS